MSQRDKIFISYRRDDSAGHVGRLHDALAQRLGHDSVFMDIDSIAPGADFVDVLQQSLQQAAVVIVVMGTRWVGPRPDGTRRIDDESDFVRLEVAKALADPKVRVIPVLINRAEMLRESELPEPLKPLARRNALEVSDLRWQHDTGVLADQIAKTKSGQRRFSLMSSLPTSVKVLGSLVALMLLMFWWKPWQRFTGNIDTANIRSSVPNIARGSDNAPPPDLSRIPKAIEMKVPNDLVPTAAKMLKDVQKAWRPDAIVDEINTDCRSGQCQTKIQFVSPELMVGLTATRANADAEWRYVNEPGTVRRSVEPLQFNVLELGTIIAKARESGMIGSISSAILTFRALRDGQPLQVWVITPEVPRNGGPGAFCFDARSALQYECNQLRQLSS